ncbi:response regulator transcription factor [Curtobacterium sp. MCBA15_004]|uniref:response regulator transcription factor n=1 Tax=unclassified Curtobacterium TaxID=257496 RepID=UPI0008DD03B8|nr:response regulator transcription factor [Curtobacterium sp. MCBA15_004]WIA97527.1 response regulator transcription factor [Curtobacterium sp. MCBA15_004]
MTDTDQDRRVAVVIEDDLDIRYLLEQVLTQAGYSTVSTGNGEDGVRAVLAHEPVVTTLDVSLPGIDGFEVARRIRASSSTYIVMISAMGDEIDVLQGLEAGADDYIVKPFRPRELRARLGAMLRRPRTVVETDGSAPAVRAVGAATPTAGALAAGVGAATPVSPVGSAPVAPEWVPAAAPAVEAAPAERVPDRGAEAAGAVVPTVPAAVTPAQDEGTWVRHNGLAIDPEARLVQVDGTPVELTKTEFDLIATLVDSRRRVRSKADLALAIRNDAYVTTHYIGDADRRAVEVHMANLRRKLADDPNAPRFVVTVRGVGYRLTGPGDPGYVAE